ncbi:MAG: NADH-quinone oxidoreductase subunit D 1, partial [Gemmatimonadetes bacterium]|nr:NADH-quinone oxidoreductase subunit D 1 [Gemmatimonadota bacterium]
LEEARKTMEKREPICAGMDALVAGDEIFQARARGSALVPPGLALAYGVSGPNLRASGVPFDLRQHEDYLPYDKYDFEVATGENGDCFDRYYVRLEEVRQAARIVSQAIDDIPSGPLQAKVPRVIKVPKGETYVRAENPKGEMGVYLVSDGGRIPYRLKIRTASFSNLSILPWALRGLIIPDIIALLGSLDFVLGDVDR